MERQQWENVKDTMMCTVNTYSRVLISVGSWWKVVRFRSLLIHWYWMLSAVLSLPLCLRGKKTHALIDRLRSLVIHILHKVGAWMPLRVVWRSFLLIRREGGIERFTSAMFALCFYYFAPIQQTFAFVLLSVLWSSLERIQSLERLRRQRLHEVILQLMACCKCIRAKWMPTIT